MVPFAAALVCFGGATRVPFLILPLPHTTLQRVEKLKTKAQAVAVKAALHDRQVALLASVVTASSSSSSSAPASASSSSSSSSPSQIAKTSRARAAPARSLVSVVTASSEERLAQMETKLKELESALPFQSPTPCPRHR